MLLRWMVSTCWRKKSIIFKALGMAQRSKATYVAPMRISSQGKDHRLAELLVFFPSQGNPTTAITVESKYCKRVVRLGWYTYFEAAADL